MNLIKFIDQFPDEASCRAKFKEFRDTQGVICRKCGHTEHFWLQTVEKYQCKKCKTRTSLRSGTVMQARNLPFRYWFIAMHLLTSTKKSFSTLEIQRQIGHKFYGPIWLMVNKIRKVMGERDSQYQLDDVVELDEGFFTSVNTVKDKDEDEKPKRGHGSQKKSTVMVLAKTVYDGKPKKKHQKVSKFRYVKMVVLDNLKGETVDKVVSQTVKPESIVKSDDYKSYSNIQNIVDIHVRRSVEPKEAGKYLPWAHTMIANAKRTLLGIHHMISDKYMQNYLDEFCYKVNRRYYGEKIFDRLLIACVSTNYNHIITDS
jgi:transposase-like protein